MKNVGSCIVSWDFSHGKDKSILLVGVKKPNNNFPDIVNAFQGEEAEEIYKKLMTKRMIPYADNAK